MYHRVAEESHDPWDLCVTPEHFAQQMSVLQRTTDCLDLSVLCERRWPHRFDKVRLAVTFDDGYRDNIVYALPILERFNIPATIFIVSGSIGSSREFWWDALERCLLRPRTLPATLELEVAGVVHNWTLSPEGEEGASSAWRANDEGPSTPRQIVFLELWNLLVVLDAEERDRLLDTLMTWASVDSRPPADRLAMTVAELVRLARHPLIQIGCHTVGHRPLPSLSPSAQRQEIKGCRDALEEWIGRPVTTFSYPYGRHNRVTSTIVRDLAFRLACTSRPATMHPLAGRWTLPRLQATDQDGDGFARWLRAYFPTLRSGDHHESRA
jgi:peptidoglycan/xylan/chitin deacetylase (PgdA/CDA1 family)